MGTPGSPLYCVWDWPWRSSRPHPPQPRQPLSTGTDHFAGAVDHGQNHRPGFADLLGPFVEQIVDFVGGSNRWHQRGRLSNHPGSVRRTIRQSAAVSSLSIRVLSSQHGAMDDPFEKIAVRAAGGGDAGAKVYGVRVAIIAYRESLMVFIGAPPGTAVGLIKILL